MDFPENDKCQSWHTMLTDVLRFDQCKYYGKHQINHKMDHSQPCPKCPGNTNVFQFENKDMIKKLISSLTSTQQSVDTGT